MLRGARTMKSAISRGTNGAANGIRVCDTSQTVKKLLREQRMRSGTSMMSNQDARHRTESCSLRQLQLLPANSAIASFVRPVVGYVAARFCRHRASGLHEC